VNGPGHAIDFAGAIRKKLTRKRQESLSAAWLRRRLGRHLHCRPGV